MRRVIPPLGVITAAGLGLRMADHAVHGCKELITIAGRSMLLRTIDELRSAGITDIVVVTSPTKPGIAEHLEHAGDMERGDVRLVEQPTPRGLVDAVSIAVAASTTSPDPAAAAHGGSGNLHAAVLVAFPDILFKGHPNPTAALLEAALHGDSESDSPISAVTVVRPRGEWGKLLSDSGRIDSPHSGEAGGEWLVRGIARKRKGEPFPLDSGAWKITGRAIWTVEFWRAKERIEAADGWDEGEMSDAAVLRLLAADGLLRSVPIEAACLDIGTPAGLAHARALLRDPTPLTTEEE